jgi:ribbon-helix-helix CopG family protein
MRTTLTLDNDVAARLERMRERRRVPLKQIVNDALREGLDRLEDPQPPKRFRTRVRSLGRPLVGSLDNVEEVLDVVEPHQFK